MQLWRLRCPTICYLQAGEPRKPVGCWNLVKTQMSENQGSWWCESGLESKDPRTRNADVQGQRRWVSQLKQRQHIWSSSTFLFCSGPQRIGWCPPALVRTIFVTQSTDSNSNLFWKHPHKHTQKCVTSSLHPLAQSGWHIKLTVLNHPNQIHRLSCSWTSIPLVACLVASVYFKHMQDPIDWTERKHSDGNDLANYKTPFYRRWKCPR